MCEIYLDIGSPEDEVWDLFREVVFAHPAFRSRNTHSCDRTPVLVSDRRRNTPHTLYTFLVYGVAAFSGLFESGE
jgi:hypothetical protein